MMAKGGIDIITRGMAFIMSLRNCKKKRERYRQKESITFEYFIKFSAVEFMTVINCLYDMCIPNGTVFPIVNYFWLEALVKSSALWRGYSAIWDTDNVSTAQNVWLPGWNCKVWLTDQNDGLHLTVGQLFEWNILSEHFHPYPLRFPHIVYHEPKSWTHKHIAKMLHGIASKKNTYTLGSTI